MTRPAACALHPQYKRTAAEMSTGSRSTQQLDVAGDVTPVREAPGHRNDGPHDRDDRNGGTRLQLPVRGLFQVAGAIVNDPPSDDVSAQVNEEGSGAPVTMNVDEPAVRERDEQLPASQVRELSGFEDETAGERPSNQRQISGAVLTGFVGSRRALLERARRELGIAAVQERQPCQFLPRSRARPRSPGSLRGDSAIFDAGMVGGASARREALERSGTSSTAATTTAADEVTPVPPRRPIRPRPFSYVSLLSPGQKYAGSQTVSQNSRSDSSEWRVNCVLEGVDLERGTLCGSMEALDVPKATAPVVTFWEGEIVDNVNFFFITDRWSAKVSNDLDHWRKFAAFAEYSERVERNGGRDIDMSNSQYIFMRWKEQFFIYYDDACQLTIKGFYYICLDTRSGSCLAYYFDPSSEPYQRLQLSVVPSESGFMFPSYEFA